MRGLPRVPQLVRKVGLGLAADPWIVIMDRGLKGAVI
jgi:hypothetical protein